MAQDMDVGLIVLHDTVGEIDLLGQTHGIHLAADAADLARILASIRVGIGEIDGSITRPLGLSRVRVGNAVIPVSPIASNRGQGEALRRVLISVVRSLLEAEMLRRKIVPEAALAFVSKVLGFNERCAIATLGTVAAEHAGGAGELVGPPVLANPHAIEFGNGSGGGVELDVIVAASADDAAAIGIPLLAQGHHLLDVFDGDHGVARFPKKDAGMVAKVNHGIARHFQPLFPLTPDGIPFLVASGADLNDAKAVE